MRRKWKVKLKNINWGFDLNDPLYGLFPKEDEVVVEESCIEHIDTFDPNDFGPWEDGKEHDDPHRFSDLITEELYRKYPDARSDHFIDFDVSDMTLLEEHDRVCLSGFHIDGKWRVDVTRNLPGEVDPKRLVFLNVQTETENLDDMKQALSELVKDVEKKYGSEVAGELMTAGEEALKETQSWLSM